MTRLRPALWLPLFDDLADPTVVHGWLLCAAYSATARPFPRDPDHRYDGGNGGTAVSQCTRRYTHDLE